MNKTDGHPLERFFNTIRQYYARREETEKTLWYRIVNLLASFSMAIAAVIPLMWRIWKTVPFTYEVNDDPALVQILDGSFTGEPEAHSIFVRYPLSWVIARLYQKNPTVHIMGEVFKNVNWYLAVFTLLSAFALTAVLFRILHYFRANRLIICLLFDMAFLLGWLPCFSNMTFSTAAAFMGCMGILFFAFESPDEAWRPWNIAVLAILLTASWSYRKPCFYMVAPVIGVEIILKYNIRFFKSWKPWFFCFLTGIPLLLTMQLDSHMYGSREWKRYLIYNQARAYLQDYSGFPPYEEHKEFYRSIGVNQIIWDAMSSYTYCMVDGFKTDWVEETYSYVKSLEPDKSLPERAGEAVPEARKLMADSEEVNSSLVNAAGYFWLLLIPLFPVTLIFCWDRGILSHLRQLISIAATCVITKLEWVYLAMNGRFPLRVKEAIWLLTFSTGFCLSVKLFGQWREKAFTRIPIIIQIIVLVFFLRADPVSPLISTRAMLQQQKLAAASGKAEVAAYCGRHPDSLFVIDTRAVVRGNNPQDDLRQGNWFLSGSWMSYSPVFTRKLQAAGTDSLGCSFLTRENVYLITQSRKNVAYLLGIEDKDRVHADIVDEFMTSNYTFLKVYKVRSVD